MTFLPPPAGLYYVQVRLAPQGAADGARERDGQGHRRPRQPRLHRQLGPPPPPARSPRVRRRGWTARGALGAVRGGVGRGVAGERAAARHRRGGGGRLRRRAGRGGLARGAAGRGRCAPAGRRGEGAVPLGTHRVEIADLPVFASLGLARTPAMVLGIDVPARPAPRPPAAPPARPRGPGRPCERGAGPEAGRVGRSCLARAGAARRAERWPSASRAASCGCDSATQRDGAWWRQRPRGAEAARGRGSSSAGTALHFDKTHCAPPAPTTRRREHARSSTAREGTARARGRRERPGRRGTGAPPAARRLAGAHLQRGAPAARLTGAPRFALAPRALGCPACVRSDPGPRTWQQLRTKAWQARAPRRWRPLPQGAARRGARRRPARA